MRLKGTAGPRGPLSRRDFLRLGGVGVAGVALLGVVRSSDLFAQEAAPNYSSLVMEFEEAAQRFSVPASLLLAMGYVNTRWEMPPPEASDYEPGSTHGRGAYGIMQLVRNDSADTLGEASRLTGIPEEELKTVRKSNILGARRFWRSLKEIGPFVSATTLGRWQGTGEAVQSGRWYRGG